MTDDELLSTFAHHAEKVASRRLAVFKALSPEQSLREILGTVAGEAGIEQLIEERRAKRQADVERLASRRQNKLNARQIKSSQNEAPLHAWQAWFDGSAKPNSGRCGIGAVLRGPHGEHAEICQGMGFGNSSEAEYQALIALLNKAVQANATPLVVFGDSQVVINDVIGPDASASRCLSDYRSQALALITQLGEVSLRWIPRHKNQDADALSQRAVNLAIHIEMN